MGLLDLPAKDLLAILSENSAVRKSKAKIRRHQIDRCQVLAHTGLLGSTSTDLVIDSGHKSTRSEGCSPRIPLQLDYSFLLEFTDARRG